MNNLKAVFVKSSPQINLCPSTNFPEYAFIGRSNVGKSSLINMLTNKANLAQVSGTPGKTKLINHFLINDSWYLVDLPGYGYAKTSKAERGKFATIITDYIKKREQLSLLFLLVDCRLEPQEIDIEFISLLGMEGVPFAIVFTKTDKLSSSKLQANIENYKKRLLEDWEVLPPLFLTSSEKKEGRNELLNYIIEVNNSL